MDELVENVLQNAEKKQSMFKTTDVKKEIELEIDEGNLLASDVNSLDQKKIRSSREFYLINLARDNTQLLLNHIWELPCQKVEDAVVAKLPEPTTLLPREKPIPKARPATKWEEYAKIKGIQKKKRGRKVWDDELKDWVPRWGYKSKNDKKKEWVLEVPGNADPYEDQFEKRNKEKRERIAKNELNRLRNIARSTKKNVPGVGLTPIETGKADKGYLTHALSAAQKSDASLGRFSKKVSKDEDRVVRVAKKRKIEINVDNISQEKKRALDVINSVLNKQPLIDKTKAGNMLIQDEQTQGSSSTKKPGGNKNGKKSSGKHFKAGKKNSQKTGKKNLKQGKSNRKK